MEDKHIPQVTSLLATYHEQFDFKTVFSKDDVKHWLKPVKNVVYTYVVQVHLLTKDHGKVTDFVSFYSLPSTVIGHERHNSINAAYLFYYAPKGLGQDVERTQLLIKSALIVAQKEPLVTQNGFDVFNCLELLHNATFLSELKFGKGDGQLHYYLFNYRCKDIDPSKMALVML